MTEKLSPESKATLIQFILTEAKNWQAVADKVRALGVSQFIRDNGWGNVEWQTHQLLMSMARDGLIELYDRGWKFTAVARP